MSPMLNHKYFPFCHLAFVHLFVLLIAAKSIATDRPIGINWTDLHEVIVPLVGKEWLNNQMT